MKRLKAYLDLLVMFAIVTIITLYAEHSLEVSLNPMEIFTLTVVIICFVKLQTRGE